MRKAQPKESAISRLLPSIGCACAPSVAKFHAWLEALALQVLPQRLDIFTEFLSSSGIAPRRHKTIETTDIMLQMVASGRGVAALPRWLVEEYAGKVKVVPVRLGPRGIAKQIHLGTREADLETDYLQAFIALARQPILTTHDTSS